MNIERTERRTEVTSLCWSSVSPALTASWATGAGTRLAVWATPVDFDECFSSAGFTEFADSGEGRYEEIVEMTARLIAELRNLGEPTQRMGEVPVWAPESIFQWLLAKLGGRVATPTLTDIVVSPMTDDNFRPCVVDFGQAPVASLCTSSGHDIWWLYLSPGVSARGPEFIDVLAGGRPVRHVEIDLRSLAPDPRPP